MTETEIMLWSRLRRKQICGVQFYRQKPVGPYITDFYAGSVQLVIEIDGSQHFETTHQEKDAKRDHYLEQKGIKVLRFSNLDILQHWNEVLCQIESTIQERLNDIRAKQQL